MLQMRLLPGRNCWYSLLVNGVRAVGVQIDRGLVGPLPQSHQHRREHHLYILDAGHRPTHDAVAVKVEHHAQVQPTFRRGDLGDVGDPLGFGHEDPR